MVLGLVAAVNTPLFANGFFFPVGWVATWSASPQLPDASLHSLSACRLPGNEPVDQSVLLLRFLKIS